MKKKILAAMMLISFQACKRDDASTTLETTCECDGLTEYICWTENGTINRNANPIGKIVDDTNLNSGYINFSDKGESHFFFEYEDMPNIILNNRYIIDSTTSKDFNIGYDGPGDIDTTFTSGTITITANNNQFIQGTFTATGAYTHNDIAGNIPSPINLNITKGCFKLLK